jgi:hypothetical protein
MGSEERNDVIEEKEIGKMGVTEDCWGVVYKQQVID